MKIVIGTPTWTRTKNSLQSRANTRYKRAVLPLNYRSIKKLFKIFYMLFSRLSQ